MVIVISQSQAKDLRMFEDLVEETIDLHAIERGEFIVNPDFDEGLQVYFLDFVIILFCGSVAWEV